MKRLMMACAAALAFSSAAGAQSVGFSGKLGFTHGKLTDDAEEGGVDDARLGICASGLVHLRTSPWLTIQTGIGITQKGGEGSGVMAGPYEEKYTFCYVEIPVRVKSSFAGGRAYATAGVNLGFLGRAKREFTTMGSTDTTDMTDGLEKTELALALGGGISFSVGQGSLSLDAEYAVGLTDLNPDAGNEYKTKTLALTVGYGVGF